MRNPQTILLEPANPGAATALNFTLPIPLVLQSIFFTLTTDGNAANRRPYVEFQYNTAAQIIGRYQSDVVQAAALTHVWTCADFGYSRSSQSTSDYLTVPTCVLPKAAIIQITVGSMQAGDALTNIRIVGLTSFSPA